MNLQADTNLLLPKAIIPTGSGQAMLLLLSVVDHCVEFEYHQVKSNVNRIYYVTVKYKNTSLKLFCYKTIVSERKLISYFTKPFSTSRIQLHLLRI